MKKREYSNRIESVPLKTIVALCVIVLVAWCVRLAALYDPVVGERAATSMDAVDYLALGTNVLDYGVFSTWTAGFKASSTRPPLYPLAIDSAQILAGSRGAMPVLILNVLFDMISVILVFLVARILAGTPAGLMSAAIYAVFGHAAYYASMIGPYTIATTLLLALILCLLSFKFNYWGTMLAFVVILAALIHIRPVFLLVSPFILLVACWQIVRAALSREPRPPFGKLVWNSVLPVLLTVLLCVPWTVRNFREHHTLIPVCTISGWHLGGIAELDAKLSLDMLMANIYAPEHKGFSEADYFLFAQHKFFSFLWRHPFLIPSVGILRVAKGWAPPTPWRRFFLPKAYVFPLRLGGVVVPLIDFEGLLYLAVFAILFFGTCLGKRILPPFAHALEATWPLLVVLMAYAFAHIIGFPRIAYRFIIEPPLIILGVVTISYFMSALLKAYGKVENLTPLFNEGTSSSKVPGSGELAIINVVAGVAIFLAVLPLSLHGNPRVFQYPPVKPASNEKTYAELREIQWRHMGYIPKGTRGVVAGVVKYLTPGFKHVPGAVEPVKDEAFVSGRLFVRFGSPLTPLGTGDVKLNFKKGYAPKEGSAIVARGQVLVGVFKWIIINVDEFSTIPPRER